MSGRYNSGSSWRDNMMNTFTVDGATIIDGEENPVSSLMNPSWEDYRRSSFTPDGLRVKGFPQKKTMPTANADQLGKVYQYVGTTTSSFTKGYFYECVLNGTTYSWQQLNVQPGGVEWGQIIGTLADQTDLQTALDAKANQSTTYTKTEVDAALGAKANAANAALTGTTTAENITVSGDLTVDSVDVETSITVPTPSDNTDAANKGYVDTADSALDARITNLQNIGRFLAIWNAATGLPTSNPTTSPYAYKTGDYYRVGTIGDGYSHALAMTGATTSLGTYSGDYTLNFTIKTQSNTQLTTAAEVIAAMDGTTRYTATGTLTTADNTYTITSVLKWLDGSTYYIAICDVNEEKLALISTSTTLTDTVTGGLVSYMPSGSSYTTGVASSTVYSGTDLSIGSVFYYDGTNWLLQAAGSGGTVQDVQVNGTSILSGGVANLPLYTTTGTNTDGPMTQNAVTTMIYPSGYGTISPILIGKSPNAPTNTGSICIGGQITTDTTGWGSYNIAIGNNVTAGYESVVIGNRAKANGYAKGNNCVIIGTGAATNSGYRSIVIGSDASSGAGGRDVVIGNNAAISGAYDGSIVLGSYSGSNVTAAGMMDIGSSDTSYGYNSSNYRLLTGLYDGQSAHDAATYGQLDTRLGGLTVLSLTQAEYDALSSYDANTLYVIKAA